MGVKKNDPFANFDTDFGGSSFDFDDVIPNNDAFGGNDDPFQEEAPLPALTLEGVEAELEGTLEEDGEKANQAAIDARVRYEMVDADRMQSDFYFTVVFQNGKQREEFCQKSGGLVRESDIYVDGMALAERLGIELTTPFVTNGKLRKAWRRLLGLAVNPGKKNEIW